MIAEKHRPGERGRVMIWREGQPVQVEMRWGLEPFETHGRPISLLRRERWEGRQVTNPCLIIANDFGLKIGGVVKYRASLNDNRAPFFCLAGVWQPAGRGWPASYAALTTEAYPDLEPFKDRHVAVVREEYWIDWLRQARPVDEMLQPFPLGSFTVKGPRQRTPRRPNPKPTARDLFDMR